MKWARHDAREKRGGAWSWYASMDESYTSVGKCCVTQFQSGIGSSYVVNVGDCIRGQHALGVIYGLALGYKIPCRNKAPTIIASIERCNYSVCRSKQAKNTHNRWGILALPCQTSLLPFPLPSPLAVRIPFPSGEPPSNLLAYTRTALR